MLVAVASNPLTVTVVVGSVATVKMYAPNEKSAPEVAVKLIVAVPATEKSEFVREGQRREVVEVGVVITSQVKPMGLSGRKTIGVISAGTSVSG